MPELHPRDLELFTGGELSADDVETARLLDRALALARTYCEWHVTPVRLNHQLRLDGSGERLQMLPTMKLGTLHSLTENGVALVEGNDFTISRGILGNDAGPVLLRKVSWGRWSCEYGAIEVDMTHGIVETKAEDWRYAVLEACDRVVNRIGAAGLKRYKVDDIDREWFDGIVAEALNYRVLEPYRLMVPV